MITPPACACPATASRSNWPSASPIGALATIRPPARATTSATISRRCGSSPNSSIAGAQIRR
ncbi:hypothetical protein [Sphingomonas abietis]|uniref:Uncharacterized protein n=1 Tax=Sphingomonas abietis TaxID=3012344 RepID=A0ABY7NNE8_9SPHN|nr:hypothetical protein [Sphingomonas abietis]WBO22102.1 hypothetical protein PBT88_18410 [Sphingomonas abietis]